jgi:type VI secretion system protein ImpM
VSQAVGEVQALREPPRLGCFGKVPMRGDFLSRRLPQDFIEAWDLWLQAGMTRSREQLGEQWLSTYLTAPIWRFAFASGVCGAAPAMGVLMPSVDRVGRYFPLVLATLLPTGVMPLRAMAGARIWFEGAEAIALQALEDGADLDQFELALEAFAPPPYTAQDGEVLAVCGELPAALVQLGEELPNGAGASVLFDALVPRLVEQWTAWWTSGSEHLPATMFVVAGLPASNSFAALLDGEWERWGWKTR